jgi:hypothetical protein
MVGWFFNVDVNRWQKVCEHATPEGCAALLAQAARERFVYDHRLTRVTPGESPRFSPPSHIQPGAAFRQRRRRRF